MKNIITAFALVFACLAASAQSYRGFIDLFGGVGMGDKTNVESGECRISGIEGSFAFGLNTSHGCQITPFLYAGLGFGVNTMLLKGEEASYYEVNNDLKFYSLSVPVFLDVRWDLNIRKKATPFVGLKIGYQFCVDFDGSLLYSNSEYGHVDLYAKGVPGVYLQPTIGYRFRMGKKSGFNLGVSYNAFVKRKMRAVSSYHDYPNPETYSDDRELGEFKSSALMLNLGFDF